MYAFGTINATSSSEIKNDFCETKYLPSQVLQNVAHQIEHNIKIFGFV